MISIVNLVVMVGFFRALGENRFDIDDAIPVIMIATFLGPLFWVLVVLGAIVWFGSTYIKKLLTAKFDNDKNTIKMKKSK